MMSPDPTPPQWFDAHLDLAYLAALGRDMLAEPEAAGGPDLPASVTLRSLAEGGVTDCLATIFTEAGGADPRTSYPAGDVEAAHRAGVHQLQIYDHWATAGLIELPVGAAERPSSSSSPLRAGILIEGADPIRTPDELSWWKDRGVVAVGMAWWKPSRYAGGNGSDPDDPKAGVSDLGRALVKEIDRLGLIHDISHLSDRALHDLLELTDRPVIASHSNSRAIMGDPSKQRHLTDETIREVARRGGVIGLNLCSTFLSPRCDKTEHLRATIDDCVAHVERVCELTGSRLHVGLGSDMDGGFPASRLPEGIDRPRDLMRIAEALRRGGWSDSEVRGFVSQNWRAFLRGPPARPLG